MEVSKGVGGNRDIYKSSVIKLKYKKLTETKSNKQKKGVLAAEIENPGIQVVLGTPETQTMCFFFSLSLSSVSCSYLLQLQINFHYIAEGRDSVNKDSFRLTFYQQ